MSTGLKANSDGSAAIQVGGTDVITLTSSGAATFVTSPTTVQAGTAAAPAITTSGDTNTGIFFPAADTIAFAEGGVEAMRIDSSSNVGIGTSSNLTKLTVQDANGIPIRFGDISAAPVSQTAVYVGTSTSAFSGGNGDLVLITRTSDSRSILFYTGNGTAAERARITSGGDFYVGDSNNTLGNTRLYIKGDGTNPASRIWANTSTTSVYGLIVRHESTTAGAYIQFVTDSNVETGRIYDSAGTMQYASSSDARLKTNVQPMQNSLQSVLALNPCTFDMRRGEDTFIPSAGLIAQEVHEVYPYVVGVGGDDENTNPWSVDYGKLTPLLVAAIKEQQALITDLQTRLAALEGAA